MDFEGCRSAALRKGGPVQPYYAGLQGRRILLAEDDYYIVEDMARSFRADGAEVVGPVATLAEAMRLLGGPRVPDAAVVDLNLRGEMAFPLADALLGRGVPFVFATGYGLDAIPARFARIRHCLKPVEPRELARALFA
ncbi:response regulator [Methylobacterium sp. A54F]